MLTKAFRNANQGVLLYELSQACLWRYAQANVLALDFVACQSKKRANKSMFDVYPLCSPFSRMLF